jgi:hypothetical protein
MGVINAMGRNHKNIKIQLNQKLDSLLRIGQKKQKEKVGSPNYNPNRSEGCHSIQTAQTYRQVINDLGSFLKNEGVKDISQIDRQMVTKYMETKKGQSKWTTAKICSALNKVLETNYTPKDFGIGNRSQKEVIHNRRILTANSTADRASNQDALWFASCTGARRETLMSVTANQAIRNDDGQVIGFRFERCKGGKTGCVLVIPNQREKMTSFVDNKIATAGQNARLISHCSKNCNPHYERGNYAQSLYSSLKEAKDNGRALYDGRRGLFIDQQKYEQAMNHPRYSSPTVRGYDTAVLAEVAQHLLHYRISSTLIYLDRDSE